MQKRPRGLQIRIHKMQQRPRGMRIKIRTTPIVMVMIKSKGGKLTDLIKDSPESQQSWKDY
jgi:hypothetical protein